MPATVLAERVGWTGSPSWFRENVARLRPEQRRPDPADRLVWAPGDAAQCDLWFPPKRIPLEDGTTALLPVLVMVAGVLAVHLRRDGADAPDPGSVVGDVVADRGVRAGATPVVVGQRVWDRPTRPARRGCRRVLRDVGHPGPSAQAARPGVKGHGRAAQRVLRDVVHARPQFRLAGRLQRPVRATGSTGRISVWCARSRPARSIWSTPTGPRCWRCRRSHRGRLVEPDPAGPRLLRARRLQRLLRRPDSDRPASQRDRRPATGPRASRRRHRRRPCPGVGPPHDRHRPCPRRRRPAAARTVRRPANTR